MSAELKACDLCEVDFQCVRLDAALRMLDYYGLDNLSPDQAKKLKQIRSMLAKAGWKHGEASSPCDLHNAKDDLTKLTNEIMPLLDTVQSKAFHASIPTRIQGGPYDSE